MKYLFFGVIILVILLWLFILWFRAGVSQHYRAIFKKDK